MRFSATMWNVHPSRICRGGAAGVSASMQRSCLHDRVWVGGVEYTQRPAMWHYWPSLSYQNVSGYITRPRVVETWCKALLLFDGSTVPSAARDSVHVESCPRLGPSFNFSSGLPDDPTYFDRSLLHHSSSFQSFSGTKT
jgi:hypothetical protein